MTAAGEPSPVRMRLRPQASDGKQRQQGQSG